MWTSEGRPDKKKVPINTKARVRTSPWPSSRNQNTEKSIIPKQRPSNGAFSTVNQRKWTYEGDADGVVTLAHGEGDDGGGEEKEDQGVFVEGLEELEVDGFVVLNIELVEAITGTTVVGFRGGEATDSTGLELDGGLFGCPPGKGGGGGWSGRLSCHCHQ